MESNIPIGCGPISCLHCGRKVAILEQHMCPQWFQSMKKELAELREWKWGVQDFMAKMVVDHGK